MENNILTQIYNDQKITEKKTLFEYVKILCDEEMNTINNKLKEEKYKNAEDDRYLDENKIFKANEFSYCFDGKDLLRVGNCIRKLFFQINNTIGLPREIEEKELYERNRLIINQWIDKLSFLKIYEEPKNEIIEQFNIQIQSTENGFIYDPSKNIKYALMIKPVNDTSFSILNTIWPQSLEPTILPIHIPEVILNLLILKKPIKVLYVGKNNCGKIQEFNIGISKQKLTINRVVQDHININYIFEDLKETSFAFTNNVIPPQKYKEVIIDPADAYKLSELNIVNNKESALLANGKPYRYWQCNDCRYKNTCNSISKDWTKIDNI